MMMVPLQHLASLSPFVSSLCRPLKQWWSTPARTADQRNHSANEFGKVDAADSSAFTNSTDASVHSLRSTSSICLRLYWRFLMVRVKLKRSSVLLFFVKVRNSMLWSIADQDKYWSTLTISAESSRRSTKSVISWEICSIDRSKRSVSTELSEKRQAESYTEIELTGWMSQLCELNRPLEKHWMMEITNVQVQVSFTAPSAKQEKSRWWWWLNRSWTYALNISVGLSVFMVSSQLQRTLFLADGPGPDNQPDQWLWKYKTDAMATPEDQRKGWWGRTDRLKDDLSRFDDGSRKIFVCSRCVEPLMVEDRRRINLINPQVPPSMTREIFTLPTEAIIASNGLIFHDFDKSSWSKNRHRTNDGWRGTFNAAFQSRDGEQRSGRFDEIEDYPKLIVRDLSTNIGESPRMLVLFPIDLIHQIADKISRGSQFFPIFI